VIPAQSNAGMRAVAQAPQQKPLEMDHVSAQPVLLLYAVRVNGQDFGEARLLRLPDGRLLARRVDLEEWRLRIPDVKPMLFRGEEHYLLDAFEGIAYRLNEARQELSLEIAPQYFTVTVVEGTPWRFAPHVPPNIGGFGNYDLFYNATNDAKRLDGLFEAGLFNRLGVGVGSFLAQDIGAPSRLVRLNTTWTRDFPSETKTLILGDTAGASGVWGRPVGFGGLQYGTNFATNPGFVTYPLPVLKGEAALPTTTELYVDGILRQSSTVPPGPFRITNVPVVTGQGEVRLVVRDLLGREQVISLPYYATSRLLREGLTDESNEIGMVRKNFGIRSNDYGRFMAVAQRRRGFTDYVTGEMRAELLRDQQTVGAGGSVAFTSIGVFTGAGALSHSGQGSGVLFLSAFERQTRRGVSFGLSSQWTSGGFVQLGLQPGQLAPLRVMGGNIGVSPDGYGSLGLSYLRQDNRGRPSSEVVSASYSLSIGKSAALTVAAFRTLTGERTQAFAITLSIGFGERSSASVNYSAQPKANQVLLQVQENLPAGNGTGYRVLAGNGTHGDREEAGLSLQSDTGTYVVEAGRASNVSTYRASASGGVALVDGRAFWSRRLIDSFGVAQVPGFGNVAVYVNNQIVGRTNADGYAVLPHLLPYQANPVHIETGDLPIDVEIGTAQLDAVPYFRSGVLLKFPVQRSNGALLILLLEDGAPMPVGSVVKIIGRDGEFPVAQRGEVYVIGLAEKNRLRITWREQSCELEVDLEKDLPPLPKLGPFTCAGVKR
jgi:outer membrane usher protein